MSWQIWCGQCMCGFVYPSSPQSDWTKKDWEAVAGHQRAHSIRLDSEMFSSDPTQLRKPEKSTQ